MTSTPYTSWNVLVIARGQAEPPITTLLADAAACLPSLRDIAAASSHTVGTAGRAGHLVVVEQLIDRGAVELGPGMTREAPAIGAANASAQPLAWNIGHDRHHHVARTRCPACRRRWRSRHAERWSGANRARPWDCRWCRRCSTCRPRCSRQTFSRQNRHRPRQPVLVGHGVLQRSGAACARYRSARHSARRRQLVGELLQQRDEGQIESARCDLRHD